MKKYIHLCWKILFSSVTITAQLNKFLTWRKGFSLLLISTCSSLLATDFLRDFPKYVSWIVLLSFWANTCLNCLCWTLRWISSAILFKLCRQSTQPGSTWNITTRPTKKFQQTWLNLIYLQPTLLRKLKPVLRVWTNWLFWYKIQLCKWLFKNTNTQNSSKLGG